MKPCVESNYWGGGGGARVGLGGGGGVPWQCNLGNMQIDSDKGRARTKDREGV